MKKIINTSNAPAPIGPYNQAILVNGFLYVSGQISIDPTTNKFTGGDVKSQTTQTLKNHQAILGEAGMEFTNVVKVSLFIADMNDFPVINEVYSTYFTTNQPAREVIQAAKLPLDAKVEISIIAAQDQ